MGEEAVRGGGGRTGEGRELGKGENWGREGGRGQGALRRSHYEPAVDYVIVNTPLSTSPSSHPSGTLPR